MKNTPPTKKGRKADGQVECLDCEGRQSPPHADGCKCNESFCRTGEKWVVLCPLHSAAPELLEALKRAGCQFEYCPGPDKPFVSMATCFRCDAIRKAEGRKS